MEWVVMVYPLCSDSYPLPPSVIAKSLVNKQLPFGIHHAGTSNHKRWRLARMRFLSHGSHSQEKADREGYQEVHVAFRIEADQVLQEKTVSALAEP
uniref:Uncharacterized protein n=1 Tax=Anguilla anguilla TaxID=7936 RepID=A0A0E9S6N9_ANGAN